MGDISEMRGLLVVASVIIIMVAMVIIIPTAIIESNITNSQTAGVINPVNQLSWNTSYVANLTHPISVANPYSSTFQLNGYNYIIIIYPPSPLLDPTYSTVTLSTQAEWWVFTWDREAMFWYAGTTLVNPEAQILSNEIDNYDIPADFQAQNTKTQTKVTISYNTTAYSTFEDALNADAAVMIFETDLDYTNSNLNAFQLIGMLYTASLPGLDPLINYLITVPLWIATIYLAFIFILRLTGALFGGGA